MKKLLLSALAVALALTFVSASVVQAGGVRSGKFWERLKTMDSKTKSKLGKRHHAQAFDDSIKKSKKEETSNKNNSKSSDKGKSGSSDTGNSDGSSNSDSSDKGTSGDSSKTVEAAAKESKAADEALKGTGFAVMDKDGNIDYAATNQKINEETEKYIKREKEREQELANCKAIHGNYSSTCDAIEEKNEQEKEEELQKIVDAKSKLARANKARGEYFEAKEKSGKESSDKGNSGSSDTGNSDGSSNGGNSGLLIHLR